MADQEINLRKQRSRTDNRATVRKMFAGSLIPGRAKRRRAPVTSATTSAAVGMPAKLPRG